MVHTRFVCAWRLWCSDRRSRLLTSWLVWGVGSSGSVCMRSYDTGQHDHGKHQQDRHREQYTFQTCPLLPEWCTSLDKYTCNIEPINLTLADGDLFWPTTLFKRLIIFLSVEPIPPLNPNLFSMLLAKQIRSWGFAVKKRTLQLTQVFFTLPQSGNW